MKTLCITLLLLSAIALNGQKAFNKHIGINVFGQRPIPEIISDRQFVNYPIIPLGIVYMQSLRYFELRTSVNYYTVRETYKPQRCYDCYYGTGKVEGLEVKAGIQKVIERYKYFSLLGGIDLGYSITNYKGNYQGGILGGGYTANEINKTFILNPYIGLAFTPFRRMVIALETGIYINSRRTHKIITDKTSKRSEQHLLPLQAVTIYWNFK
jgi:hypothetical protein